MADSGLAFTKGLADRFMQMLMWNEERAMRERQEQRYDKQLQQNQLHQQRQLDIQEQGQVLQYQRHLDVQTGLQSRFETKEVREAKEYGETAAFREKTRQDTIAFRNRSLGLQEETLTATKENRRALLAMDAAKFYENIRQHNTTQAGIQARHEDTLIAGQRRHDETLQLNRERFNENVRQFGIVDARRAEEDVLDAEIKGYEAATLRDLTPKERVQMLARGTSILLGGKPAPQGEREAIQNYQSLLDTAMRARALWKKSYTGPIEGSEIVGGIKEAVGMTDEESRFRMNMKGLVRKMYQDAGKQLSDTEWLRLEGMMPRMRTADSVYESQMDEFIYQIFRDLTLKQRGLESSGYIVPNGSVQIGIDEQGNFIPYGQPAFQSSQTEGAGIKEGTIQRNQKTGARRIYRSGQWQPLE